MPRPNPILNQAHLGAANKWFNIKLGPFGGGTKWLVKFNIELKVAKPQGVDIAPTPSCQIGQVASHPRRPGGTPSIVGAIRLSFEYFLHAPHMQVPITLLATLGR